MDAKYAGTGSGTSRDMLPALYHEPLARSTHSYCRAGAVLISLLQARLVALVAAQQLSIPMQDMEGRLDALMVMLPDLGEHQGRSWVVRFVRVFGERGLCVDWLGGGCAQRLGGGYAIAWAAAAKSGEGI